jgi:NAD(P)-dependent dehydrogenase (short-subunit alcohol dehydrogenase family)
MIRRRRGLIVEVTEGDLLGGGGDVISGLVKAGLKELAFRLAWELRAHRVAALAITPGFLRSESMPEHFKVTEATWRDGGRKDPHFLESESPIFVGRAVAALAADPRVLNRTGSSSAPGISGASTGSPMPTGGGPTGDGTPASSSCLRSSG